MNFFSRLVPVFFSILILAGVSHSASIPNNDNPVTFLGPTIKAGLVNRLVEDKAYSLAGEAGPNNWRISGTYGWKFSECQRLKITAEYLWQDITYAFFSGNTNTWVNQGALGAAWQYDIGNSAMYPQIEISAYGSHAQSKTLGSIIGTYVNAQGIPVAFNNDRRIAGSNSRGFSPSFAISPWRGSRITAALDYDDVNYNTKYLVNDVDTSGFGGTLKFNQMFANYFAIGMLASIRQPFNNYSANLTFNRVPFLGTWSVGVFGDYVSGKNRLPNTYNLGVSANYYMDQTLEDDAYRARSCAVPLSDKMLVFVSMPAVYMPQVLAIPENLNSCGLIPVQYLGAPNTDPGFPLTNGPFDFSFAPLFSGASIVYSLAVIATDGGAPTDFSINPTTGLLSYAGGSGNYNLTVTGSNACSSASVSFVYNNED